MASASKQCTVASLNCYVPKVFKVSVHSTQAMHAWHATIIRFNITLLSTKLLNSLEKIVMVAEKSLSWIGIAPRYHLSYKNAATLVVVYTG